MRTNPNNPIQAKLNVHPSQVTVAINSYNEPTSNKILTIIPRGKIKTLNHLVT